jgi:hypothetical protein
MTFANNQEQGIRRKRDHQSGPQEGTTLKITLISLGKGLDIQNKAWFEMYYVMRF